MKIFATYINYQSDPDVIELALAWDEYTVDSNPEGYREARQREIDKIGSDLLHVVDVEIEVPMEKVYERFRSLAVKAYGARVVDPE